MAPAGDPIASPDNFLPSPLKANGPTADRLQPRPKRTNT